VEHRNKEGKIMTDEEIIAAQQKAIVGLQKKILSLKKRLVAKMKYEETFLTGTGANPSFIAKIQAKDRKALEGL
jgi:hypothetical protein